ncbi:hypothetical protein [Streptomyces sp. NPDC001568]|uniref:hypothetical protein n=1 Tax=Streptomyces sp. NPDC001568 TaxID=3364588 RepID=UPI0036A1ACBD
MTARETDLTSQRRWFDKWWVVALMALVVGLGVRLFFRDIDNRVAGVVGALVYAVGFTVLTRLRQRGDARVTGVETDDVPVLDRRIRRGDIPDDPALRRAMLQLVQRRQRMMRGKLLWAFPAMLFICVALGAWLLAVGTIVPGVMWMVGGFVFVGGMWWMRRINIHRLRRVERRLTEPPARDPGRSPRRDQEKTA